MGGNEEKSEKDKKREWASERAKASEREKYKCACDCTWKKWVRREREKGREREREVESMRECMRVERKTEMAEKYTRTQTVRMDVNPNILNDR